MPRVLLFMIKLLIVVGIQNQGGVTVIQFEGGQNGQLSSQTKGYDYYLKLAQRSMERKHPVGVLLDDKRNITELVRADNDIATQFAEHDKERMKVVFQGHDGTYFLHRNHPEFDRISGVLRGSIQNNKRVWFVAKLPTLLIQDVIFVAEEPAKH